ncbi:ribosome biogenesis regulatory protein homolog [Styela clava]|uniref:ribosome biogenesis regulatory protein homolog n=1 Tax=Styela clava TaxID=7725 RepID=UPI001939977C|nr:ribosome biogenesis regulatory protein homolog [Styela clava]
MEEVAADASQLLKNITEEEKEKLKSITVEKDIDLEFDLGNLIATDSNLLDSQAFKQNSEDYIKKLTRDNTQLLFNEIWKLPVERVQEAIVAKLPDCTTVLPREKKIPKPKPLTKWQQYAQLKGIQNRKRGAMVWDETAKDWKPRFGYKRANDESKEWVLEVPSNADPYEDQFEKRSKAKKERVAKNELQRLRNIAKRTGRPMPGAGAVTGKKQSTKELESQFHVAKRSTASLGRFEDKIKNEKPQRNMGKKRKFDPVVGSLETEKSRQLKILSQLTSNQPKLNKEKAANKIIHEENKSRESDKPKGQRKGGKNQRGNKKFNKRTGGKPKTVKT